MFSIQMMVDLLYLLDSIVDNKINYKLSAMYVYLSWLSHHLISSIMSSISHLL